MTVKERPILMHARSIRGILDGRKTQTRRIVKPIGEDEGFLMVEMSDGSMWPHRSYDGEHFDDGTGCEVAHRCPYGHPGERLWVRETFWPAFKRTDGQNWCVYRADYAAPTQLDPQIYHQKNVWKPSIYMPRWASRLTLEITDIRVEKIQDIGKKDAKAEGAYLGRCDCAVMQARPKTPIEAMFNQTWCHVHGSEFKSLWNDTNGKGAWERNDWVWVVGFRRIA